MDRWGSGKDLKRSLLALAGWFGVTFLASAGAMFVSTNGWYADLHKPSWNPPPGVFAPVWTALYAMMAIAAWLVWQRGGWRVQKSPLILFLIQWLLNALWTPLFFGLHRPDLAFAEIVLLWGAVLATLAAFWRVRTTAGLLLLPYFVWLTFALALNFVIWRLNC